MTVRSKNSTSQATPAARGDWVADVRPAVVFGEPGSMALRVAALTVLDRLLVAIHRAGFGPITVVTRSPLPPIPRARAWQVPIQVVPEPEPRTESTLLVEAGVLVSPGDLRRLREVGSGQLADRRGERLPVAWVPAGTGDGRGAWMGDLPVVEAEGVAMVVKDEGSARRATAALWSSITSSSDGWVDRVFNRPVGRPLARLLVRTPVTPNQVSLLATVVGMAAAAMFGLGDPGWSLMAAVVFQISAILDCVDGDVARVVFKESRLGRWLDLVGDQVVHVAVFLGIGVGLARAGTSAPVVWLGAAAAVGAVLSFAMVLRGMKRGTTEGDGGRLQRWLDLATNRDFSVLVLVLAWWERLEWFLWMAAIGSQAFWLLLGWAQRPRRGVGRGEG